MDAPADCIELVIRGPAITWDVVADGLDVALRDGLRAWVPPCYVEEAVEYAPTVDVITTVSLPHGQETTRVKCTAAEAAWQDGVAELEVVANFGALREDADTFETDIAEVVAAVPVPVTVVVDAPELAEAELRRSIEVAVRADADFLKLESVSTGATPSEHIALVSDRLPVKVGRTIESAETAQALFDAGVARLGTPAGEALLEDFRGTE